MHLWQHLGWQAALIIGALFSVSICALVVLVATIRESRAQARYIQMRRRDWK
jgi:hypothetical protein